MANLSLHHLIQSIAGAVAEAQDKIHRYQISTVRQYFDADNRPVSVDVRLPSMAPDAQEGDERLIRVPLLSLIGARLLAVKDMEISFDVGLGGQPEPGKPEPKLSPAKAADAAADGTNGKDDAARDGQDAAKPDVWPSDTHAPLSVDMSASKNRDGGPMAHITLRVESQPPSEGMARLIHHLDKSI